jgi:hypothetical protein
MVIASMLKLLVNGVPIVCFNGAIIAYEMPLVGHPPHQFTSAVTNVFKGRISYPPCT